MRPEGPDPETDDSTTPDSRAIFFARGLANTRSEIVDEAGAAFTDEAGAATTGVGVEAGAAGAFGADASLVKLARAEIKLESSTVTKIGSPTYL